MAIAKIKKLEIIGLGEDKDKILAFLQKLGMVEIIDIRQKNITTVSAQVDSDINLIELKEAIAYLAGFQEKTGFLKAMLSPKPVVYEQQLKELLASFDYRGLLSKLSELRNHLKNLSQHKEHLIQERRLLAPWRKLKIPLDQIHYTESCGIFLGVLRTADYANLLENCDADKINLFCNVINQDKSNTYLVIFYIKEAFEHLEIILRSHHFNFVTLGHHKGTVEDRILEINREVVILDDQTQDTKDEITGLAGNRFQLMTAYDYFQNIRNRQEIDKNLARQKFTFTLSGWLRQGDLGLLEKEVMRNFKEMAIFISDPTQEEDVPVVLENRKLIRPFEFITQIYGMPKYNELDPTPFLAPFFFIYFGFCVSDAGYGLIIVSFCWWALKKIKRGPMLAKAFRLFLFCGISTIIIGALTGSWFGNLFDIVGQDTKIFILLRKLKDSLVWLDPLKEPTKLLGIALSLGLIQVWFGNIIAAVGNIKNKRYMNVLLDQVTMLTLLFGLTPIFLMFLGLLDKTHALRFLDKIPSPLYKYAALLGMIAIILTQGRSEKGLGSKLFYGAFVLYNSLSGYLSDILSYSRLWALGLVTGVMAGTVNLIALQFSQILPSLLPVINKISFLKFITSVAILVFILIAGHAISFVMNLLGAFIHPLRLQFVEFFSKFFKSGGNAFKPFKVESKYINLG